jgi:2-polyprenyl-3-methyl-5-hydroxy-6-metoxy-1,4-benzoquinol methylase
MASSEQRPDLRIPCPLCGGREWRPIDNVRPDRSVRTDGGIVLAPLDKHHCAGCGLAYRPVTEQALSELYSQSYQLYANRPGAEQFDRSRYVNLADGIVAAWGRAEPPQRVLEVGCGDGSLLEAVAERWPGAACVGLEPSETAVESARRRGRKVLQGVLGESLPAGIAEGRFDLVYSVHVIEHTSDPAAFLKAAAGLTDPGGRLAISCPDGAQPQAELVHCDHLYSMTRAHLAGFAVQAGLGVLEQGDCPGGASAEPSQLMVCAPTAGGRRPAPAGEDPARLYDERQAYIAEWRALEGRLLSAMDPSEPLYAFGAGGWASNIAGYCPALWDRVAACAVDGGAEGEVQGKPLGDYAALAGRRLQFVIAVNPAVQQRLADRLQRDGHRVLPWPPGLAM